MWRFVWRGAGIRAGVLCLFLISLASGDSAAQDSFADNIIREIIVEGAQRIEPATVVSYLTVRPGDRFGAGALDDSLKSLFATGLFADVVLRRQGAALSVSDRQQIGKVLDVHFISDDILHRGATSGQRTGGRRQRLWRWQADHRLDANGAPRLLRRTGRAV